MEIVVFNEDGQLVTGGFTDYAMPRATHLPEFNLGEHRVPTATNPLGVKGGGEGGTVGAASTVINAVVDALSVYGITDIEMPATSLKVWQAIQSAQTKNRSRYSLYIRISGGDPRSQKHIHSNCIFKSKRLFSRKRN